MRLPINLTACSVPAYIQSLLFVIRGQWVIPDRCLTKLYNVSLNTLHEAVKLNPERFTPGSVFQLTMDEAKMLDLKTGHSPGRKSLKLRYAFTADSILTLSSIFRSERAMHANRQILQAFIHYAMVGSSEDISKRIDALERTCDDRFQDVFETIDRHMRPPVPERGEIGFRAKIRKKSGHKKAHKRLNVPVGR